VASGVLNTDDLQEDEAAPVAVRSVVASGARVLAHGVSSQQIASIRAVFDARPFAPLFSK
jgi:hypothetical protein